MTSLPATVRIHARRSLDLTRGFPRLEIDDCAQRILAVRLTLCLPCVRQQTERLYMRRMLDSARHGVRALTCQQPGRLFIYEAFLIYDRDRGCGRSSHTRCRRRRRIVEPWTAGLLWPD